MGPYAEGTPLKSPLFILAGNGPYDNRGCEGIVRGTIQILREAFDRPKFLVCSQFRSQAHCLRQQKEETDPDIRHVRMRQLPAVKRSSFLNKALWKLYLLAPGFRRRYMYKDLLAELPNAAAVLSIGGDNYSLEYNSLLNYIDLDDLVLSFNKKLVIWGASVGPFSGQRKYENFMPGHLNRLTAIFAREPKTVDYLKTIGVERNVFRTADPAILMEEKKPDSFDFELGARKFIGINLNPLMAKFVCGDNLDRWRLLCVDVLQAILQEFEHPILLVPHVTDASGAEDDHLFMKSVHERLDSKRVFLLPSTLDAAQIKWVIGRCRVFAGARTHATLAAFSSGVPTLCFGYSLKAEGISYDIYGHEDFCLSAREFSKEKVIAAFRKLFQEEQEIREILRDRIPTLKRLAYDSGARLKKICG